MSYPVTAPALAAANQTQPKPKLIEFDQQTFQQKFNHRSFYVSHRLTNHPLFQLPEIIELSKRLHEDFVEYYQGNVPISIDSRVQPRNGLSIQETIRRIEECGSWLVLKCAQTDRLYGELLDECLAELAPFTEPLSPGMCGKAAAVFVASPGSITPYHMDHEINFLLQIRGEKEISIFNRDDRTVVAEEEFEKYFTGDRFHRNMEFKDEWQQRANVFKLKPGTGVHVPANAPHWVKNYDNVSISFAVYFLTAESDRYDSVWQVNSHLRKLGLTPTPVGQKPQLDTVKHQTFRALRRVQRAAKGEEE